MKHNKLAEHVWEHMTYEEGCQAAKNCYDYLADGGYLRVAVPDRNFRNEWYQNTEGWIWYPLFWMQRNPVSP